MKNLPAPKISPPLTTRLSLEMSSNTVSNKLESEGEEHYFKIETISFPEY